METRRMSLILHQLRVRYERALTSVSGSAYFRNLLFLRHKRYLMSVHVVSIWRKLDQYSPRYDQKSDGAVMLSPHHGGALGHIRL